MSLFYISLFSGVIVTCGKVYNILYGIFISIFIMSCISLKALVRVAGVERGTLGGTVVALGAQV